MNERWKPECYEKYWFVDTGCKSVVMNCGCLLGYFDHCQYDSGNCFKTKEEAEAAAEKVRDLLLSLHDEQPTTDCNQLPKLTADIFNHPDCPIWAEYAAVDRSGIVCFFDEKPKCDNVQMWLRGEVGEYFKPLMSHKFNASDWQNSLVKRPENNTMPDWCKVGAIGFNDEYFKIIKINDKYCTVLYLDPHIKDEDGNIGEIPFDSLTRCHESRLRPYNEEEMKALVGKIVEHKSGSALVTACFSFRNEFSQVRLIDKLYSAELLLEEDFYIEKAPCGVLEHFENGEWVK